MRVDKAEKKRFAKFKNDLWRRYRLCIDKFQEMLEAQDHRCAICGGELKTGLQERHTPDKPVIDHCHESGLVRGVLCHRCNLFIGHAKHDIDRLHRAIVYLAKRSVYNVTDKS